MNDTDGDGDCAACARNPQAPCRQTAEERLVHALMRASTLDPDTRIALRAQAKQLMDDYVHQRAEALRTRFAPELRATNQWADGWLSAADYLDGKDQT